MTENKANGHVIWTSATLKIIELLLGTFSPLIPKKNDLWRVDHRQNKSLWFPTACTEFLTGCACGGRHVSQTSTWSVNTSANSSGGFSGTHILGVLSYGRASQTRHDGSRPMLPDGPGHEGWGFSVWPCRWGNTPTCTNFVPKAFYHLHWNLTFVFLKLYQLGWPVCGWIEIRVTCHRKTSATCIWFVRGRICVTASLQTWQVTWTTSSA